MLARQEMKCSIREIVNNVDSIELALPSEQLDLSNSMVILRGLKSLPVRKLMTSGLSTPEMARSAMIQGYRRLPFEQAPAHQALFSRLAAGEVPLVFNCAAGKDRAGTAAALILSALGVPREIVIEDYVLTDRVVDLESIFMATAHKSALMNAPGVVAAVLRSDPSYLHAALDAVEEKHGTVAGYLRDALGITEEASSTIRQSLLE
jgi:protein-tyrosine phosphatase